MLVTPCGMLALVVETRAFYCTHGSREQAGSQANGRCKNNETLFHPSHHRVETQRASGKSITEREKTVDFPI
jgi:3-methyladenine DNA glycosylase Mpg